jgi:hypothetical protein
MRLLACALAAALALAACGKYGPPVRTPPTAAPGAPKAAPAPVGPETAPPGGPKAAPGSLGTAPATSDTEQCNDPNAVPTEAKP